MAGDRAVTLATATQLADELTDLFQGWCVRWEIAGSIRRGKSHGIKDIEIVAVPKTEEILAGLFGEPVGEKNLLLEALDMALAVEIITKRKDDNGRECWGPRHQRAVYKGQAVDIFQVIAPAQWGTILTIRTGPADYSRRLVTAKTYGGHMPFGMKLKEGALYRGAGLIPTPEEVDFFTALGIDWIPPGDRA